jgi:hypothetical protein
MPMPHYFAIDAILGDEELPGTPISVGGDLS